VHAAQALSEHLFLFFTPAHATIRLDSLGLVRSGKTSILFHFAHSRAAAGERVVFICKRAKVEQVPPLLPAGVNAGHPAFSNIHMRCRPSQRLICCPRSKRALG